MRSSPWLSFGANTALIWEHCTRACPVTKSCPDLVLANARPRDKSHSKKSQLNWCVGHLISCAKIQLPLVQCISQFSTSLQETGETGFRPLLVLQAISCRVILASKPSPHSESDGGSTCPFTNISAKCGIRKHIKRRRQADGTLDECDIGLVLQGHWRYSMHVQLCIVLPRRLQMTTSVPALKSLIVRMSVNQSTCQLRKNCCKTTGWLDGVCVSRRKSSFHIQYSMDVLDGSRSQAHGKHR